MKKLSKLQINSSRLMKNEELNALRGGYGYVACYHNGSQCGWTGKVGDCSMAHDACDAMCGEDNWDSAICAE